MPTIAQKSFVNLAGISMVCALLLSLNLAVRAAQAGIVTPDQTKTSLRLSDELENILVAKMTVADLKLASDAFSSVAPPSPYNQTVIETKKLGTAIGCRFLVFIRSGVQQRASLEKSRYFEAFAAVYVTDARDGVLISWMLKAKESSDSETAEQLLIDSAPEIASEVELAMNSRLKAVGTPNADFVVDPDEDNDKLRMPMPFRRLKPEYTRIANLFGIEATIDIAVSVDAKGNIVGTRILRWAGFGLEESVDKTIREMKWRPADRNGVPFPMTVMLRYNFKEIENP